MKRVLPLLLLSLLCLVARAQNPVVPNNIFFADMKLQVEESARTEIQKIVDALTKHPAYFQKKVDLADAYFPFIERTLEEEGVPTDVKYLVLQESGLTSDAVSTSNAVGFWQFKEASATELGIKVNQHVDERKHIIESTRGAAKYLIRNNNYYKNWFNSLLSYYQGLTGTKALTKTSDIGAKKMTVDGKTNKYLLTFLAHKIAYENAVGKNPNPPLALQPVKAQPGQTLIEIAMQAQADAAEVERYNKWLTASTIPADKDYTVMIPLTKGAPRPVLAQATGPVRRQEDAPAKKENHENKLKSFTDKIKAIFTTNNDLKSIVAQPGDTKDMLAMQAGISTKKFLKNNDMHSFEEIVPGQTYYLTSKKSKAENQDYHIAQPGETMHAVSQKYGVKLKRLLSMNRMKKTEALVPGRVVWLQQSRPRTIPVEIRTIEEEAPAAAPAQEVLAKKPASSVSSTPATPSATTTAAAPVTAAAPAKPKEGSISIEVEDPAAPAYVPVAKREEEDTAPATSTGLYPTKTAATAPKAEPKAAESKPMPATQAETPAEKTTVPVSGAHVVAKGETLYSISRQYNLAMEDLLAWNNIDGSSPLSVGQELSLTGPATATTATSRPVAPASSATATATPASTTAAASEHTVAAGETLYSISRKYGVTLQELQAWNELGTGSLAIGQKLRVAAPASSANAEVQPAASPARSATGTVTHKVAPGESMYAISRKYGVTIKEIMEWNNKPDFNVSVGESLLIKPKQ
ncbi:LysM peptidoglycan-binding domain-containing protein [Rufibacter quisquiliarum]|uniref:Membrane-bound lytic murein transglycosylase D n=1 Tax=Rufibacter quisquiliarum TaxID=1549639 RepID=A0A839GK32_9BACT|nr:LysM peptidoglycan-binding domain-containing protein [Rufibacter quisquiliarum]MBA9075396.1 membrane-bound lytic murein transglycosylase D [Rufibacter quisquiliarum]